MKTERKSTFFAAVAVAFVISSVALLMAPERSSASIVQCDGTWYSGECTDQNHNELTFTWGTPVTIKVTTSLTDIGPGYLAHFYWMFLNTPTTNIPKRIIVKPLDLGCFLGVCYSTTDTWTPDEVGRWRIEVYISPPSGSKIDPGFTHFNVGEGPPPPPPGGGGVPALSSEGIAVFIVLTLAFGSLALLKKVLYR